MSTCCCTLAGTAACATCPNNPFRYDQICVPPVMPYWVSPRAEPLGVEELLARLEKLVDEMRQIAGKDKEVKE